MNTNESRDHLANSEPEWHKKAIEALQGAIELFAPGSLTFAVGEDDQTLAVAPSPLDYEGQDDTIFSFFHLDVSSFAEIFDEPPTIDWRTYPASALSLEGRIDGEEALVHVFEHPFPGEEPVAFLDQEAKLHERAETVET